MRKKDVQVGRVYMAKVSGHIVPVRIDHVIPSGGWVGMNVATHRVVRIRTAARLRQEASESLGDRILAHETVTADRVTIGAIKAYLHVRWSALAIRRVLTRDGRQIFDLRLVADGETVPEVVDPMRLPSGSEWMTVRERAAEGVAE